MLKRNVWDINNYTEKNENKLDGVKMNKKSEFYDRSGILCYLKGKM